VSFHERLCLVRSLTGNPHPVTFLFTYPSADLLPSTEHLSARVDELQVLWPHMHTRVGGIHTNAPYWTDGPRQDAREIVFSTRIPPNKTCEKLLQLDMDTFGQSQIEVTGSRPLLRITRYLPTNSADAYLAISVNHYIADGIGAARLAQAILAADVTDLAPFAGHPPKLEDTVDLIPPSPPAPNTLDIWPGSRVRGNPADYPGRLSLLQLPPTLVSSVMQAGKAVGLSKLHAIFKAAWAIAMWTALSIDTDCSVTTPRSERGPTHPYAMGNYISRVVSYFTPTTLSAAADDLDAFWDLAKRIAADLSDPDKQQQGRYTMGAMAYIPNAANDPSERTAWEEHYLAQSRKPKPYGNSATLSNLTYMALPSNAVDLCWAQPSCPFSVPFMISIVGTTAGVSWTTTWRDGCILEEKDVKGVEAAFIALLTRIST
jgi:hypothetical protein